MDVIEVKTEVVIDLDSNEPLKETIKSEDDNSMLINVESSPTTSEEKQVIDNDLIVISDNTKGTDKCTVDSGIILVEDSHSDESICIEIKDVCKEEQVSVEEINIVQDDLCNDSNNTQGDTDEQSLLQNVEKIDEDICIVDESVETSQPAKQDKISPLAAIALEYGDSDSDTESIKSLHNNEETDQNLCTMDVQMQNYRLNKEMTSSSEESDSEDDSSTSSSSEVITVSDESDSDTSIKKKNEGNRTKERSSKKIKNELDDLPPIEDLTISVPEVLCDCFGEVAWMVEQLVVVRPTPGKPTLNLDTVLFVNRGQKALGKIFDVFGQVNEPHYCVRFNSTEHIHERDVKVGMKVYYCPNTQYTSLVFLHELMKLRGTDGGGDDEPPEFSDDEEEQAYYATLQQRQTNDLSNSNTPSKRRRATSPTAGWQTNHPWNRNMQRHKRDGYYANRDNRQFPSMQNGSPSQHLWTSFPYQNIWAPGPRYAYPGYEQYGYETYPPGVQPMEYANQSVNNTAQSSQDLNPISPYNLRPRFPPAYGPLGQNNTNFPNPRFRNPRMFWQPRPPQMPVRMNTPWISLPPPPPPPPPPSSGTN